MVTFPDGVAERVPDGGAVVLFDGVCNLCSWSVRFVHTHDDGTVRFAPLQSAVGTELLAANGLPTDYFDSLVYLGPDGVHTRSAGAVRIARHLRAPYDRVFVLRHLPEPVRDTGYDLIGRLRYRLFGRKDSCMVPERGLRERFLTSPTDT
jgi:predicted DCC family thiol-disulfide oxidoreductase YuxK